MNSELCDHKESGFVLLTDLVLELFKLEVNLHNSENSIGRMDD